MKQILITNDDGLTSPGLKAMENALEGLGDIWVFVPDKQRSGAGRGLTVHREIILKKISERRYVITATPASAVIIAKKIMPKIDLVASGINLGANIGFDAVTWSGTCGAAFEAAGFGIPAVAASLQVTEPQDSVKNHLRHDFAHAEHYLRKIFAKILDKGLPKSIAMLNINFPNCKPKGVSVTTVGGQYLRPLLTEKSKNRFLIGGEFLPKKELGNDVYAVLEQKHVSITPITLKGFDVNTSVVKELVEDL